MSKLEIGDLVTFGAGQVVWRVVAITTTGRHPTYDLIEFSGTKPRRRQAVRREKLVRL